MLNKNNTTLKIILAVCSLTSLINILMMYWLPIIIPTTSFLALRIAFVSFAEKRYYLLVISVLICVGLFITIFSINKHRIFLPILTLIYIFGELSIVFFLFVDGLGDGYWITYVMQLVVLVTLIVLLYKYCHRCLFLRK